MVSDDQIRDILRTQRRVAVVGMSKNPGKDAHRIPKFLIEHGYTVIPVNPTADEILGLKAYPSLTDVTDPYDIVNIFRPSDGVPPIVEQTIPGPAKTIWMQLGIRHPEAAGRAEAAGKVVIQNRCMKIEYERLVGP